MGQAYGVNGFINAALRRKGKTLLVEGVSDKTVMHRFCADIDDDSIYVIDHAGLLSSEELKGLGNREKIIRVRDAMEALLPRIPRLADTLAILVDREWDGLPEGERRLSENWSEPEQIVPNYFTLGHSIENYSFRCDHMIEYLKMKFSTVVSPGLLRVIKEEFNTFLVFASCVSLAIQEHSQLKRAAGALRYLHVNISSSSVELLPSFADVLIAREIDAGDALNIVNRANSLFSTHQESLVARCDVKWLPHGHVGEDAVWACIAACAHRVGLPHQVCEDIASGAKLERQKFMASLMAKEQDEDIRPLRDVANWLAVSS